MWPDGRASLELHARECTHVRSAGSFFSGNRLFLEVRLGAHEARSQAEPEESGVVRWDWSVQLPSEATLELQLKREGLLGPHLVGGGSLPLQSLPPVRESWVRMEVALRGKGQDEVGRLHLSFRKPPESEAAPAGVRGLTNLAAGGGGGGPMGPALPPLPGGSLVNRAGTGSLAPAASASAAASAASGGSGLVNYARMATSDLEPRPGFARGASQGLANLATVREAGSSSLPRVEELLAQASPFEASSEEHRQRLAQALEIVRRCSDAELSASAGRRALEGCGQRVEALFVSALSQRSEKDAHAALWLAGRLPSPEEEEVTLQMKLRQKWDEYSMEEAQARAQRLLRKAAAGGAELEDFMDALDLAEFHGQKAQKDPRLQSLLLQLETPLAQTLQELLSQGEVDKAESIFATLGANRTELLGLQDQRRQLLRSKGLRLLKAGWHCCRITDSCFARRAGGLDGWASNPKDGLGFPELKQRQLRHAVLQLRSASDADDTGTTGAALAVLLQELGPKCFRHGVDSGAWMLRTVVELRLEDQGPHRAMRAGGRKATAFAYDLHRSVPADRWCVTYWDLDFLCQEVLSALGRGEIQPGPDDDASEAYGPSIYTVTEQYIKPVTKEAGKMSWALMRNPDGLQCDLFISHAWQEGVFEFLTKVKHGWPCAYEAYLAQEEGKTILIARSSTLPQVFNALRWMALAFILGSAAGIGVAAEISFLLFDCLACFAVAMSLVIHNDVFRRAMHLLGETLCWIVLAFIVMNDSVSVFGAYEAAHGVPGQACHVLHGCYWLMTAGAFCVMEVDRVNARAAVSEAEQLRRNYQGSIRYATCSEESDAVRIRREIGYKVRRVDHAIHVLLTAGMSTPALRDIARSVDIEHAAFAEMAGAAFLLGPFALECVALTLVHLFYYRCVGGHVFLVGVSLLSRVVLFVWLCCSHWDEQRFILKVMNKFLFLSMLLWQVVVSLYCCGLSVATLYSLWLLLTDLCLAAMLSMAVLGVRGVASLPGGLRVLRVIFSRADALKASCRCSRGC
ncbi:unnamed protein product [Effrenium voratum]|nr:unnamed protein product [Effrenium voratum]